MSNEHNQQALKEKLLETDLSAITIKDRLEQEGSFHTEVLTKLQSEAKSKYRLKSEFHFDNVEDIFKRLPEIYARGFVFKGNTNGDVMQAGSGFIALLQKPLEVITADLALIDTNTENDYLINVKSANEQLTAQLEQATETANEIRTLILKLEPEYIDKSLLTITNANMDNN